MKKNVLVSTLLILLAPSSNALEATPVTVTIENGTDQDLRCLMVFGHWTTIDVPLVGPGGRASIALYRGADRALFVPRPQDGRPMMLEALHCGYDRAWSDSLVKLDWTRPMLMNAVSFRLLCGPGAKPSCRWL